MSLWVILDYEKGQWLINSDFSFQAIKTIDSGSIEFDNKVSLHETVYFL